MEQFRSVLHGDTNPFTKTPYSSQYKTLRETRKQLAAYKVIDGFLDKFNSHQVLIVAGSPGCGKSTQIPQFVAYADLPFLRGKVIACTQPRKDAAVVMANRVANELDVEVGQEVGYSTTFHASVTPEKTFLEFMTDDRLLRDMINNPDIPQYSTIIVDDANERTVSTDILLALLKTLAKRRSDLKIVVISTPPYAAKLQKYFKSKSAALDVALFAVASRTYSVEIFYTQQPEPDYFEAAIRTVLMIHRAEDPGDILLFLIGEDEIADMCRALARGVEDIIKQDPHSVGPLQCIPLHADLPLALHERIYDAPQTPTSGPPGRRVIMSTNIAETSIAIQGIVYVVDPGFSMYTGYNPRIRVNYMLSSPISKVSAQHRAEHAGRAQPGKCFRLYTERDFVKELEKESPPGILMNDLAAIMLTLVKLGCKDLVRFDYVDVPAPETLMRALELLNYLGALDDDGNLTALGGIMAEFPLSPQLSKMLIASPEFFCSREMVTIVSMLSVPLVWLRPSTQRAEADAAKVRFIVPGSDNLTLLNVFNQYMSNREDMNWAEDNYLAKRHLDEAVNIREHLCKIMDRFEMESVSLSDEPKLYINIKRALVCGFFMQVAHKEGHRSDYLTFKDNQVVTVHPSSTLNTQPAWVIFHEFLLTYRPFIWTISEVRPEWLLELAPTYFDVSTMPRGETKQALLQVLKKKQQNVDNLAKEFQRNVNVSSNTTPSSSTRKGEKRNSKRGQ